MTCRGYYALLRPVAIWKDIHEEGAYAESAWHACCDGDIDLLRLCLRAGLSPLHPTDDEDGPQTMAMMCIAHEEDRVDLLKEFLTAGLDIHGAGLTIPEQVRHGAAFQTLLHVACDPAMVAFLLALGFQYQINTTIGQGIHDLIRPPLSHAIYWLSDIETIRILLDAGADPTQLNVPSINQGVFPLHLLYPDALSEALTYNRLDVAQLLVQRGAPLNPVDRTIPMMIEIDAAQLEQKLSIFVPLGLSINQVCPVRNMTRLWGALFDEHEPDYLQTMLRWGADPRQASIHDRNFFMHEQVRAFQALLLHPAPGSHIPSDKVVRARIAKARFLLEAEGVDAPEIPNGYASMLAWAVQAVPLNELELAIRTMEPWVSRMHSDATVAANLKQRVHIAHRQTDVDIRRPKLAVNRVESFLRQYRVPGFITNPRPSRRR